MCATMEAFCQNNFIYYFYLFVFLNSQELPHVASKTPHGLHFSSSEFYISSTLLLLLLPLNSTNRMLQSECVRCWTD